MIIANHKMNLELDDIKKLITAIKKASFKPIICPTAIYASYFVEAGIKTGLQNIYLENSGPYTGEISPSQAKSMGIEYVMIGHSERRRIFEEEDKDVNLKIKKALENNLKVILCVGENIGEDYKEVLKRQITLGLEGVEKEVIISYEPVYAIGSNIIPSREELMETIHYIKKLVNYDVKVLYGGSVNLETAEELKDIPELSGYLIGSAGLDIEKFIEIGEVLS